MEMAGRAAATTEEWIGAEVGDGFEAAAATASVSRAARWTLIALATSQMPPA